MAVSRLRSGRANRRETPQVFGKYLISTPTFQTTFRTVFTLYLRVRATCSETHRFPNTRLPRKTQPGLGESCRFQKTAALNVRSRLHYSSGGVGSIRQRRAAAGHEPPLAKGSFQASSPLIERQAHVRLDDSQSATMWTSATFGSPRRAGRSPRPRRTLMAGRGRTGVSGQRLGRPRAAC